ncbi:hypothetical protein EAH72_17005 [Pseudomonas caspiana]|nr:hypothetical protein [Pseudomonas caspiana]TPG94639.1 hypothetical protein EAH72_17005 [Pseudomonas caspiana]
MRNQDPLTLYFNDVARNILYSLVDRKDPDGPAAGSDDTFEHSISAVFTLFALLAESNTPDLYPAEWQMVVDCQRQVGKQRLPGSLEELSSNLVLSIEDLSGRDGDINSLQLAWKIAGFSSVQQCAVFYHVQRHLVAKNRGQHYPFPAIQFKG